MNAITAFNEQDVLCGRGGGTLRHPGNKKYRSLIKSSKSVYLISSKNEKTAISRSIVAAIRKTNGRFLERAKGLQSYYDIGNAKATEKTSQALREGQPKLRKKLIDHGIITDDFRRSCSFENSISLSSMASATQIDPNPVFIGDASYSSIDKNDTFIENIDQQRSMLQQSLNHVFTPSDDRQAIGNCLFHPTDECQFEKPRMRIVSPPATPQNIPQQPIQKFQIDNGLFTFPFPRMDTDEGDFDDSNSIMTFEMDENEMIDDDVEDYVQPIFPTSTPSPSLTNHIRALNELKDNVPIYDNSDQPMFSHMPASFPSPISNHLRALTELKHQVPIYPSSGNNNECHDHRFNNSCQLNGNVSTNNFNASCSSMEFEPNLPFPMFVSNRFQPGRN